MQSDCQQVAGNYLELPLDWVSNPEHSRDTERPIFPTGLTASIWKHCPCAMSFRTHKRKKPTRSGL